MSTAVDRPISKRREMYDKFVSGIDIEDIAESMNMTTMNAMNYIKAEEREISTTNQIRLRHLKEQTALANEEHRQKVQSRLTGKYDEAIEALLSGKKMVVETAKDGTVTIHEFVDTDVVAAGVREFRKTVSMEERPAPPQTIIQNINQGNAVNVTAGPKFDFESELKKIRKAQKEGNPEKYLEAEVVTVDGIELPPEDPKEDLGF